MNEEKNLQDLHSLQEVAENFSLTEIFELTREEKLTEWLEENFYFSEIKKITDAVKNEVSTSELKLLLCKIFNLDFSNLQEVELEEISEVNAQMQRKELFSNSADTGKNSAYVENQSELVKALKSGAEVIYLVGAEFRIPVETQNKIYVGINNAVIDLTYDSDLDLDSKNIILENLQVYLQYPITLTMEKSSNVKILNGTKKILGIRPTLKEIFEILRGKNAFETDERFKQRVENIRGVAVGSALLNDKNYNCEENKFNFQPQWNFDYIKIIKNYTTDKEFSFCISPEDAEKIYNNERKLQIFADFTYIDGKITILNLYFETNTLGRVIIGNVSRDKMKDAASSGDGLAYGLHIITAYRQNGSPLYLYKAE